jgi:hypothetical protein
MVISNDKQLASTDQLTHETLLRTPDSYQAPFSPGAKVLALCLALDFLLLLLTAALDALITHFRLHAIAGGALYGILIGQLAMAAIWLGIMATALYWMLVSLILFCILVLALVANQIHWPSLLTAIWGWLTFTLPFALVRVAGFRLKRDATDPHGGSTSVPLRFPLSRLFAWTFVVAALLAIYRAVPAAIALSVATALAFFATSILGLATLYALLWPGPLRRTRAVAPIGVLTVALFFGRKWFGWQGEETIAIASAGIFFIVTLAGLLSVYRRAGVRLLAKTAGGWLVR